jgi:hypothetical protein
MSSLIEEARLEISLIVTIGTRGLGIGIRHGAPRRAVHFTRRAKRG